MTDGFEQPVREAVIVLLDQQMYQKFSATSCAAVRFPPNSTPQESPTQRFPLTGLSTVLQYSQPGTHALVHSISNWQPTQWKSKIIQEVELLTSDTTRTRNLDSHMRLLLYEAERTAAHILRKHACIILVEKPKRCTSLQTATMKWKCVSLPQVLRVLIGLM
jgi:hypothetical protein